ncbi:MAG: hypothetical protein NTX28_10270 [Novosphingobium sp.]|nr:hypothetical protein [Novosphingobium sp.]
MGNILMLRPESFQAIAVSRGTGSANLLTIDPREVWIDSAVGSAVEFDIDFGEVRAVDTVFLGALVQAHAEASWTITGGVASYNAMTVKAAGTLRVPERAGRVQRGSHAFWHGDDVLVRFLRISVTQPVGQPVLAIGVLMAGQSFVPAWNMEWGGGRAVRDTGSVTRLPSGSVAAVEGARYGSFKWTLSDLTDEETDYLFELQLDRGETRPLLVVEDPDQTPGLLGRIHYGQLTGIRHFERRNPKQTRWEFQIDSLVATGDVWADLPTPALTLGAEPLSFGGEILTIGD